MDAPRGTPPAESPDLAFESGGERLNAIAYLAAGPGPHPSAILLHGFPGNERNLDLAQVLRRAGWNAFFFHYRGSWGSGGEFSFSHALEDVSAAVSALGKPDFAARYRVDPARIVLVGHSMGGGLALISAAELPAVKCVASLAGADLGRTARALAADSRAEQAAAARFGEWGAGRIRGSGAAIVAELEANPARFSLETHAAALAAKPVLLVAAARDDVTPPAQHHDPLVAALRAAGAARLRTVSLDADHAFSEVRVALARTLIAWLASSCTPALNPS